MSAEVVRRVRVEELEVAASLDAAMAARKRTMSSGFTRIMIFAMARSFAMSVLRSKIIDVRRLLRLADGLHGLETSGPSTV